MSTRNATTPTEQSLSALAAADADSIVNLVRAALLWRIALEQFDSMHPDGDEEFAEPPAEGFSVEVAWGSTMTASRELTDTARLFLTAVGPE